MKKMNAFGIDTNTAVATNEVQTLSGITTIKDTVEKAAHLNRALGEGILFVDEYVFRMQDHRESVAKVLA
jgi:hypothetical protein